jgi:hypothetical protein
MRVIILLFRSFPYCCRRGARSVLTGISHSARWIIPQLSYLADRHSALLFLIYHVHVMKTCGMTYLCYHPP